MRIKTLKLYIWEGTLCSYTCGIMFALAYNVEEARKELLRIDPDIKYYLEDLEKNPKVIYLTEKNKPIAFTVHGDG